MAIIDDLTFVVITYLFMGFLVLEARKELSYPPIHADMSFGDLFGEHNTGKV